MTFYAKVRKADQMVVGTTVLSEAQAAKFPTDADVSLVEITEAQYAAIRDGLFHHGSDIPKFRWDGTKFVNNPDTRPVVTFTPTRIKAEVGDVVMVEISHSNAGTGLREFTLNGVPTRVNFVNGEATMAINTEQPGRFFVSSIQKFRVVEQLEVTIFTRELGRLG